MEFGFKTHTIFYNLSQKNKSRQDNQENNTHKMSTWNK